jgi:sugar phosphate isomerase/epimerase
MKIGATTFVFRYLLRDPGKAPPLERVVEQASEMGLQRLQICENARPLDVAPGAWGALLDKAKQLALEIQMGAKTLTTGVLESYLARASAIPSRTLRVVLEDEGSLPTRARVDDFLQAGVRLAEKYGMRLAIENHFDIPVRELVQAVRPYPAYLVGFCVDVANSLRRFEPAEFVFECLGPRAFCYHLKDFTVLGSDVGFTVGGVPLGRGALDLDWVLGEVVRSAAEPEVYLENWVPSTGVWERDVQADREWLLESIANLRLRL